VPQRIREPGGLLPDLPVGRVPEPVAGGGGDGAFPVDVDGVAQDLGNGERDVLHGALHAEVAFH
jgi:hypothetical protein